MKERQYKYTSSTPLGVTLPKMAYEYEAELTAIRARVERLESVVRTSLPILEVVAQAEMTDELRTLWAEYVAEARAALEPTPAANQ